MAVVIRGRTSGNSEGVVKDVHFSVQIPYPSENWGSSIKSGARDIRKVATSGSVLVEKTTGKIVGLHVAGSSEAVLPIRSQR